MKEIKVPVKQFDLKGVYEKTIEFIDNNFTCDFHSTYFILPVDEPKSQTYGVPPEGWDVLGSLQRGEYQAFFPFALADDECTHCADGTVVKHPEDDWDGDDEDMEGNEEEDAFSLSMTDTGGFLVQIKDGLITINSAVHFSGMCPGPMPSVDLEPDCGALDYIMTRFVVRFVK